MRCLWIQGRLPVITAHGNPYKVSDTAALVMLWASSYNATNPLISTYLKRLDLSAGM
ncbi:MAG: hypothetical protein PHF57_06020 [Methanoregula sp.]|nr:hypothetical protein [Methanoregula sp.]